MAIFNPSSRKASRFAIATAIMSLGALGATTIAVPASAQRTKRDAEERKQREQSSSTQANGKYSKDFLAAFVPIDEAMEESNPDYAALKARADAARSTISNDDDRYYFGSSYYNIGTKLDDMAVQRAGMEMMLASGKVPQENLAQYNFVAGQLAYNTDDFAATRTFMERAIELGYDQAAAQEYVNSSYSKEGNAEAGLSAIAQQINQQVQAGQKPSEALIRQGLTVAYNNDYYEDATKFSVLLLENYPSKTIWADSIAIQRNMGMYSDAELLDLLRLARVAGAMRESRDYTDYISAANYRVLPTETAAVAQEGIDAGMLQSSDPMVREATSQTQQFADGLRADLGTLARDARASGASGDDALIAADAYLNFGEAAQAAEFYQLALTRPGVDQGLALTRLGIAQHMAGDNAAAQATLAKVEGNRAPIAQLWAAYAKQQASGGAMASAS